LYSPCFLSLGLIPSNLQLAVGSIVVSNFVVKANAASDGNGILDLS
jgi:hypothetical protein